MARTYGGCTKLGVPHWGSLRWTPHPAIVTVEDNKDYIRVLLYSYFTTMTGWGVLLRDPPIWETSIYESLNS